MEINFLSDRRTFIKQAALLGGSAVLLAIGSPRVAHGTNPVKEPQETGQGYRLTEHIKKYYETARE